MGKKSKYLVSLKTDEYVILRKLEKRKSHSYKFLKMTYFLQELQKEQCEIEKNEGQGKQKVQQIERQKRNRLIVQMKQNKRRR